LRSQSRRKNLLKGGDVATGPGSGKGEKERSTVDFKADLNRKESLRGGEKFLRLVGGGKEWGRKGKKRT